MGPLSFPCAGGGVAGRPRLAVLLALALLPAVLAGCGGPAAGRGAVIAAPAMPGAPAPLPGDPIAAFAAQARPGAEARVTLADGQPATLRLARAYNAASGRECREVLVGAGVAERAQLVCRAETGAWVAARPLLRGGATQP